MILKPVAGQPATAHDHKWFAPMIAMTRTGDITLPAITADAVGCGVVPSLDTAAKAFCTGGSA